MNLVASCRSFGGQLQTYTHQSTACRCEMRFSVYLPPGVDPRQAQGDAPVLYWLSGLTCTEENFMVKAGAQRYAAEHGLVLIAPDTSPRGAQVPDDPDGAWDFGSGAGFYINATEEPWS
ncbi:MAG: S-formylglutathione hydrolase, partial [bacterium]|nr:S-formylglutathione hydrolase [bacterium]